MKTLSKISPPAFLRVLIFLFVGAATATASNIETVDIRSVADFSQAEEVVEQYIVQQHSASPNHICIVAVKSADDTVAWVLWREGGRAILWEPGENDLALSRRNLDLHKDVVETEDDLQGSTYLVTKDWVAALQDACIRHGREFVVGT